MKFFIVALLMLATVSSFASCEVTEAEELAIDTTLDHFIGGNVIKSIKAKPFKRLAVESNKKDKFEIVQLHNISYKSGQTGILIVLTKVNSSCKVTSQVYSERSTKN